MTDPLCAHNLWTTDTDTTLEAVSLYFGRSVESFLALNAISPTDPIPVGTQLTIPDWIVSLDQMRTIGWKWLDQPALVDLNDCLIRFEITTAPRVRHFISQCSLESGCGRYRSEIADGTRYEERADIGNVEPGDGPRFKGAGYLQLTGRVNYQRLADHVGDPRVMEGVTYVAERYPWTSGGVWWMANQMNALCDGGATVREVTRKVNGGYRALAQREEFYAIACAVFGNDEESAGQCQCQCQCNQTAE
jgi:putative chitinase